MQLNSQQLRLLKLLIDHDVKFLVIGGHAVLEYSKHRQTNDLDILLSRSSNNARRFARAISAFAKHPPNGKRWEDILTHKGIRLAYPSEESHEADLLTSIDGIDFGECYRNAKKVELENLVVPYPGLRDLIQMKLKSLESGNDEHAKEKDKKDIEELKKCL